MAVADTIRVELVWKLLASDFAVNVLHFTTGATDPLVQAMVDAFGAAVETAMTTANFDDHFSTGTTLDRVVMRDLRTDGNGPLQFITDRPGTIAQNPMPAQTCLVTTLRTTNGSRRGRGRIYWPAMANNQTTSLGTATSQTVVDATLFVVDLMSVAAGALGNLVLGVYSRADDLTRTVTQATTDTVFDVQTRRRDLSIV